MLNKSVCSLCHTVKTDKMEHRRGQALEQSAGFSMRKVKYWDGKTVAHPEITRAYKKKPYEETRMGRKNVPAQFRGKKAFR
jgi:hypothetical protein